jgi:hypothetical protein
MATSPLAIVRRSSGFQSDGHCQLNPLHVLVAGQAAVGIVPPDRHVPRLGRGDRATVGWIAVVTNASAGFEFAGFVWGHFFTARRRP